MEVWKCLIFITMVKNRSFLHNFRLYLFFLKLVMILLCIWKVVFDPRSLERDQDLPLNYSPTHKKKRSKAWNFDNILISTHSILTILLRKYPANDTLLYVRLYIYMSKFVNHFWNCTILCRRSTPLSKLTVFRKRNWD